MIRPLKVIASALSVGLHFIAIVRCLARWDLVIGSHGRGM
ncbi:hypothetical protein O983_20965 [Mycobacterium avium 09-5983]|nr:hypothetical protein O984_24530 [Mycobacterium avium 05-4293]ETB20753.1 hypothetical protein O983_20965 [Mycobacterium avium 09-5983]